MQMTLTMPLESEACARCGHPIHPGQPMKQTATVDITDGRVVASPPRSYHLNGGCPSDDDGKPIRPAD